MPSIVPHRFLFRYCLPVRQVGRLPKLGRKLLNLSKECRLPEFHELDHERTFGELRLAWNPRGLAVAVRVEGKQMPLSANVNEPTESDGLQIWIDTRNTQSIHRASRFCHHFCLLPAGWGAEGGEPVVLQRPIARAREDAPLADPEQLPIVVGRRKTGYELEAWIPAEALTGYDPEANPLLGFYYYLLDAELGEQFLTVGREFPFAHDPSLWVTLELRP